MSFGRAMHVLALAALTSACLTILLIAWTVEAQVRYSDYSMLGERHAALIADSTGAFASEPVVVPISPTVSHLQWRAPGKPATYWEVFELKDNPATSTRWWFLVAFCSPGGCDFIRTDRATLEIGGQVFEISRPELAGHPYAPEMYTAPYTIRIWARSGPAPFQWRASLSMPVEISNPLWLTDPQRSRMAIRQDEVWTDSSGSSTRWNYLGKGAGIGYVGNNDGWAYGVAWAWRY